MAQTYEPIDRVPLPPPDAEVLTTACDYCIVGCGYKVYRWPLDKAGGPTAAENALGADFPTTPLSGRWFTPNQHNIVLVDGVPHNVVVKPDPDATVVNRRGNHSIRGGTLALKCYNPNSPTADRLQEPLVRVNGELTPVSWDTALDAMATVSRHVLERHGESAWGMKTYSYEYFENTYAISKLAFRSIGTPAYAPHDKPGPGNDTADVDDSGIITFSASYEDWASADVIFISGTDPFETKTIVFTEWMMQGKDGKRPKIISVMPRRTTGVAFGGGLFLPVIPGSDTVLHMALARIILENGWEDREWIDRYTANLWEINAGMGRGTRNTPWQWRTTWGRFGTDYEGYKDWLFEQQIATLESAERVTGVTAGDIKQAAEMLAKPVDGVRPKTSFAFEKGNYWSNNYLNTASFAALGLLCGAGNRPGQVISRLGGHQRGWMAAAPYPRSKSPEKLPGRRQREIDLDRWVEAGKLWFAWVIGTTWMQAMAASDELTRENPNQITNATAEGIADALTRRADSGGMVVVHQDIYLRPTIGDELADIVLPAATWGEEDFARAIGERRLRLYSKFYDPPGQAKPDWWIISRFAQKMSFSGYDWETSNDVFEEAAKLSRGGILDYYPLVVFARRQGKKGHELLRELGTTGIQTPIRVEDGELVGTKRLHDSTLQLKPPEGPAVHKKWLTAFKSQSGKALFIKSPWELFSDFYERIQPRGDELWVTSGRINEIWQSDFDDRRKPYLRQRWPDNFVEIHPQDAAARGIESGDFVRIWSDDVLIQTGGFVLTEDDAYQFTKLEEAGHIKVGSGESLAVAMVTEAVRPGVLFVNFPWPGSPVNSLVHRVPDPITNRYRFKLGKGRIEKTGESPFKRSFEEMTFAPRMV
ncbi:MAG: arsenate reductase (azurin) large subunit [Chloroflexi bacterium]|nr:arsenate reductase (azurin) large subunit [Chloroflexota bacterium]